MSITLDSTGADTECSFDYIFQAIGTSTIFPLIRASTDYFILKLKEAALSRRQYFKKEKGY